MIENARKNDKNAQRSYLHHLQMMLILQRLSFKIRKIYINVTNWEEKS